MFKFKTMRDTTDEQGNLLPDFDRSHFGEIDS